ncbi:LpqB family beta-propeller domain-containing protein [Actinoplanes utahensis]|uniref:LpqB family beta-propeller domain-containing protein n=2 Tax=Actinoplanes utahensis TaxID=1869 RepID=UPI00068D7310|nr:LpqB family beta-propeller domain-containing protein [Actinoplanes utahensis]
MVRRVIAGAAVVVLLLGGCGIADESGVTDLGPGPSGGTSTGNGSSRNQVTRDSTSDRVQFVNNYLRAAAGDYDGALERVKQFMSPAARARFSPAATLRVIRLTSSPLLDAGQERVSIDYELVGTLGKNGLLEPAAERSNTVSRYEFGLEEVTGDGLYVTNAPPFLLLSDTALADFYDERTIYFWNTERTGLVPDVRYLLNDVPIEQEPTVILNWLIAGPAPWLRDAVEVLPDGTKLEGKVPEIDQDRLVITLSAQALPTEGTEQALDRLRRQVQWSLRRLLPEFLDLRVGHQETRSYSGTDFLTSNLAYRSGSVSPERYVVYNRAIRRLEDIERPNADSVPGIAAEANKDISRAALSTSGTDIFTAVVTGSGKGEQLRVGTAPLGTTAALKDVSGLPPGIGYPVWAITPVAGTEGGVGLVIADGRLWRFQAQGGPAQLVQWQGVDGPISAITVAPDGHRVALVAGGRLYRAVLTVSGDRLALALSGLEELEPPLRTVTAVDFSGESWLTVSGVGNGDRTAMLNVSIDGALQSDVVRDMGKVSVTYLTAYPANPALSAFGTSVLYSTGSDAWEAFTTSLQITAEHLAGPPEQKRDGVVPGAPLFLN